MASLALLPACRPTAGGGGGGVGQGPWQVATVDAQGDLGRGLDLSVGPDGLVHLSYWDAVSGDAVHAWKEASGWRRETVLAGSGAAPSRTWIHAGGASGPVIGAAGVVRRAGAEGVWEAGDPSGLGVWAESSATGIRVSTFGSGEAISVPGFDQKHLETARPGLHQDGQALVVTFQAGGATSGLAFASSAEGCCELVGEWVDTVGEVGRQSDVAVGADGTVWIAYTNDTNGDLKLAWKAAGEGWRRQTLDDGERVGEEPAVGVAPDGTVHVAYRDLARGAVKHAWLPPGADPDGGFVLSYADSQDSTGEHPALAEAPDGALMVMYRDAHPNFDLKRAWLGTGGEWRTERAATEGNLGTFADAVFADGVLVVAHHEARLESLLVTTLDESNAWATEDLRPGASLGSHITLAKDEAGALHLAYLAHKEGDLWYATRPPAGEWRHEVVAAEGRVGWAASLALGPGGPAILFHDVSGSRLRIAWHEGGDWRLETVAAGVSVGPDASLAFTSDGTAHALWYDKVGSDLRHSWSTPAGWRTEAVWTEGDAGGANAAAIAPDGSLLALFHDETGRRVLLGRRLGGRWTFEVVDDRDDPGDYLDLAVLSDGRLAAAYRAAMPVWDLRVGIRDAFP